MNIRRVVAWWLIALGVFLLFLGLREVVDSRLGQRQPAVARRPAESPKPSVSAPPVPDLGPALARLLIPRLRSDWFFFEGTGSDELRLGPGHLAGTVLPGVRGNCVIAGHRDTHFRVLKDIRPGDEILIQTRSGEFRYRVTGTSIVLPTNTRSLRPTGDAVLNLVTCYPFYYIGPAPKRFVVRAEFEGTAQNGRRPS